MADNNNTAPDDDSVAGNPTNELLKAKTIIFRLTEIPQWACAFWKELERVHIEQSVRQIRDFAFVGCSSLREVTFAQNLLELQNIGEGAFFECSSLLKVIFPEDSVLEAIKILTFGGCESLHTIHIPFSCRSIGDYCFQDCKKLADVTFLDGPDGQTPRLESIAEGTFQNCVALTRINLESLVNLSQIGNDFLEDCYSLRELILPAGANLQPPVTLMNRDKSCLQHIKIQSGATALSTTFRDFKSIETLEFWSMAPREPILENQFAGCSSLHTVIFPNSMPLTCWPRLFHRLAAPTRENSGRPDFGILGHGGIPLPQRRSIVFNFLREDRHSTLLGGHVETINNHNRSTNARAVRRRREQDPNSRGKVPRLS